ncbi:hypothetical protein D3C73_1523950 [compost metagenome]
MGRADGFPVHHSGSRLSDYLGSCSDLFLRFRDVVAGDLYCRLLRGGDWYRGQCLASVAGR